MLALEPLYVMASMYNGQKHGLWLVKVCGAMDLKFFKSTMHGTFKPLAKMPSPKVFFQKCLEFEVQCLSTCLHAIDLLEVCYDLDIKSYDDLPVWAYEPLDKIHFFVNPFRNFRL
jgi:hypothetical protein